MRIRHRLGWALAVVLLLAVTPASAKKGKGDTEPGRYSAWQGEIDELEIVVAVDRAGYRRVVVSGFDTSSTPLPEKEDNTYEAVETVLAAPVPAFVEGLREELQGLAVEEGEGGEATLVVVGVVEEMDPGSRAKRYWGGFGAGAARAKLRLEVKDGGTGQTLLRITQERRSGVGVAGGDYVKLMERNLRAIGKDLALVLNAF